MISKPYKTDKPNNITSVDKVLLKADCTQGSLVNGIGGIILYRFALDSPPGHKESKEPRIKLFKKIIKSVLSPRTFSLEDDLHKPIDFINEVISFLSIKCSIINK